MYLRCLLFLPIRLTFQYLINKYLIEFKYQNQIKVMFSFLQKKIAVPAQTLAHACAWDHYEGWLAIGASVGFLKLLKLDDQRKH